MWAKLPRAMRVEEMKAAPAGTFLRKRPNVRGKEWQFCEFSRYGITMYVSGNKLLLLDGDPQCNWCMNTFETQFSIRRAEPNAIAQFLVRKFQKQMDPTDEEMVGFLLGSAT